MPTETFQLATSSRSSGYTSHSSRSLHDVDDAPLALENEVIERARQQITAQGDSVWSCGPNQLARSMILLGYGSVDQTLIKNSCPRVCGTGPLIDEIQSHTVARHVARSLLRWTPIGPPPRPLARFAAATLAHASPEGATHLHQLSTFAGVLQLFEHELSQQRPVLILIGMGPLAWHYWNVVGLNPHASSVSILETNQSVKQISLAKLEELMMFSEDKLRGIRLGWLLGLDTSGWIGRFNCISFLPHAQVSQTGIV